MSIIYFPSRVYRSKVPAIDRVMAKRKLESATGSANTVSAALDVTIHSDDNWMIDSISFTFSNTNPRDFGAFIKNGRSVVDDLNNYLWFYVDGPGIQKITLTSGFYTGTELATELQTQLNTNAVYAAAGVTFTVVYSATAGTFTVTTSGPNIGYLDKNKQKDLMSRDSIAGHLFGFTQTTQEITLTPAALPAGCTAPANKIMNIPALSDNVSSDTLVFGLDSEIAIVNVTSSSVTSYYHNTLHVLTMDQAVHLTSNVGVDVTTDYIVNFEAIV